MKEFEEALNIILKNTKVLSTENIPIEESIGSVLNEDIISKIEMPPFYKSAMDGYAVISEDTKNAPVNLNCIGLIQAGESFRRKVKRDECVKIMTGAPLPDNTDSVVMVEKTRTTGKLDQVEILGSIKKGKNVCIQGEDLKIGERVLKKGTCISQEHIAIIAAVGRKQIKVVKKPKVGILNTGGEIIPVGRPLPGNKIYNSNGPMLSSLLKADGIQSYFLGIAQDEAEELKQSINEGLKNEILLISGGVSVGDYDLVPYTLKSSGVKEKFHNVGMKPGRPLYFGIKKNTLNSGKKNNTLVFGIPGNPISNFLTYYLFIRPAIYKMMGYDSYKPQFKEGIVEQEYKQKTGRKHFVLVNILKNRGQYYLSNVNSHGSADINALSRADGFMVVDKDAAVVKKNSKVKFLTWKKI